MKTAVTIVVIFASGAAICQNPSEAKVPVEILTVFNSGYSDATAVEWKKENELHEAKFKMNEVDHKVLINAFGEVVMHSQELLLSKLPDAVIFTLNAQYKDHEIDNVEKIERQGDIFYQIKFSGAFADRKIDIFEDGKVYEKPKFR